ncbi:unnamed protein product, partial [Iphiclides podalirius]
MRVCASVKQRGGGTLANSTVQSCAPARAPVVDPCARAMPSTALCNATLTLGCGKRDPIPNVTAARLTTDDVLFRS